jgi:hypothetical protein
MATYAQVVGGGAAVEAPSGSVDTRGMGSIGSLFGELFGERRSASGGGSASGGADARTAQLNTYILEEAQRARAMADQGDSHGARIGFNRSMIEFNRLQGSMDANLSDQITSIIGSELGTPEFMLNPTDRAVYSFTTSEAGQQHMISAAFELSQSGEEFTQDQVVELAMRMADDLFVAERELEFGRLELAAGPRWWATSGMNAFDKVVFEPVNRDFIKVLDAWKDIGYTATEDDIRSMRAEFNSLVSLNLPGNISPEQLSALQARVEQVNKVFDSYEEYIDNQEVTEFLNELMVSGGVTGITTMTDDQAGRFGEIATLLDVSLSGLEPGTMLDIKGAIALLSPAAATFRESQLRIRGTYEEERRKIADAAASTGVQVINFIVDAEDMTNEDLANITPEDASASLGVTLDALSRTAVGALTSPEALSDFSGAMSYLGEALYNVDGEWDIDTLKTFLGPNGVIARNWGALSDTGDEGFQEANARLRTGIQFQRTITAQRLEALHDAAMAEGLTEQEKRYFPNAVYDRNTGLYIDSVTGGIPTDINGRELHEGNPRQEIIALTETLGVLDTAFEAFSIPDVTLEEGGFQRTELADRRPEIQLPDEVAADTGFLNAVNATAERGGFNSEWLLQVIAFETRSTWSPSVRNPGSTATGLIQFLSETANNLGTTTEELAAMTREEQMVYVGKYLEPFKGRIRNVGDLYMAIHWPAGVGKPDDYVMYREGDGTNNYRLNRNLDAEPADGVITRGEAVARVQGIDTSQIRGFNTAPGERRSPADSAATTAPTTAAASGSATGATAPATVAEAVGVATETPADAPMITDESGKSVVDYTPTTNNQISKEVMASLGSIAQGLERSNQLTDVEISEMRTIVGRLQEGKSVGPDGIASLIDKLERLPSRTPEAEALLGQLRTYSDNPTTFNTPEEAEAAFERGELKVGDIITLDGVRVRVDDGDF